MIVYIIEETAIYRQGGSMNKKDMFMKSKMNSFAWAAWVLVLAGALNWGLYGVLNVDVVQVVFSTNILAMRVVYAAIGLAGVYWTARTLRE